VFRNPSPSLYALLVNSIKPCSVALGLDVSIGLSGLLSTPALAGITHICNTHSTIRVEIEHDLDVKNLGIILTLGKL